MARVSISAPLILLLITQGNTQFFDFFNFNPLPQSTKIFGNEYTTTRRPKVDTINLNQNPQVSWKNTSISFSYDGIEREERPRENARGKKRRQPTPAIPTLLPIFNYYTTIKSVRKTTKVNRINATNNRQSVHKKNTNRQQLSSRDVDVSKNTQISDWYDRPVNNVADNDYNKGYEDTTRPYNYDNNRVIYNTNDYTTKRPYYTRPGVKPVVVDNRPPITNKPVTQRPYRPDTGYNNRPTQAHRPETERPYKPDTQRPFRPDTQRPATSKPTVKPYIVNPIPTQAGAVVFPHEDEPPEIIRGPDEDYMSETEKRRYIEMAEKMCDKYKSLNTKQLAAIPLLPSPEPVSVNVSQCAPTQIPLVVGGKVVTINEFPHMALLGWVKIDSGGYSWKCGGSLISDQHILTAAHCSYEERDNTVITGPPRVVQLGSSYLDDPGALVVRVAAVTRHPKYKFPKSYFDLAILKLVQPVSFSEVIKPACLGVPPPVDRPIIATGWGKTEFGGDQSLELRSVSLPVWNIEKCRDILGTSRKMPQGAMADSQLCAGEKRGGKDTCQGDSGGPAQLQDGCVWRVVAVTSLGRSCGAPNTPGLYALVQRAFIAAAVFGNVNSNNNNYNSNNNNYNSNNNNYNGNNNNDYTTTTTRPYKSNRRTTTDYNHQQNDYSNRRTTTTTESFYNLQQNNNYGSNNNNRRTTTMTDSYYNQQNNYNNQNSNRRTTTTTESYYNPPQSDYDRNHRKPDSYDTGFNNQENKNNQNTRDVDIVDYYNQQNPNLGSNNQQNDYWNNNRPRNYYRRNDGPIWYT